MRFLSGQPTEKAEETHVETVANLKLRVAVLSHMADATAKVARPPALPAAHRQLADAVREAGFDAATTTRRGRAQPKPDFMRLPRIQVARHHLLPQVAAKLMSGYEDRRA